MKDCIIDKKGKISSKRITGLSLVLICSVTFILDSVGIIDVNENLFFSLSALAGGLLGIGVLEKS